MMIDVRLKLLKTLQRKGPPLSSIISGQVGTSVESAIGSHKTEINLKNLI